MLVRHMKASNNGRYLLAAEYEKKISAFDSVTGAKLGEYDTKYGPGDDRLCISDSGKLFAQLTAGLASPFMKLKAENHCGRLSKSKGYRVCISVLMVRLCMP